MELPKIDLPTYDLLVPSLKKKYLFRPFTVREEKVLLIAAESKDTSEIIRATLQVVGNCSLDPALNVSKLPYFDIDYLFIALRAKSIGESIVVKFTCNHNGCGNIFPATLDISNVAMVYPDVPNKIEITSSKGMVLKYPDYTSMKQAASITNLLEAKLNLIVACIDYIYDKDQIFKRADFTDKELLEFVEGISEGTLRMIDKWIERFPTFHVAATETCEKCNYTHSIRYDKFSSFFLR
jgi:hypothetical protein